METKVLKKTNEAAIPEWLNSGAEVYFYKDEIVLNIEGKKVAFNHCPAEYKEVFESEFAADKEAQRFLKHEFGLTNYEQAFQQWLFCKFGGIDNTSDLNNKGKLTPDKFNNVCTDADCPHRGRFCGVRSKLNTYDVQTVRVLSEGKTIEKAATTLFLSIPGAKSRINAIKEKTGMLNMAQLMMFAAKVGAV